MVREEELSMEVPGSGHYDTRGDAFSLLPFPGRIGILCIRRLGVDPLPGGLVICGCDHTDIVFGTCEVSGNLEVPVTKIVCCKFGDAGV